MLRDWFDRIGRRQPAQEPAAPPVDPAAAQEWLARGNAALGLGQLAEAADCYGHAIAADPRNAAGHLNRGYARLELGRPAEALQDLDAAAAIDPALADVPYLQAQALGALGRTEDALAALRRAVAAKQDFAHAWRDLVAMQANLGRANDALRDADAALQALPGDVALLEWRGKLLADAGRDEEALAVSRALVEADPGASQRWANLGIVLYRLERYDEALRACERAVALPDATVSAWYNLGCCHSRFNDCDGVLRAAEAGLALDPGNGDLRWLQALAWLLKGDMRQGWPAFEARWDRKEALVPTRLRARQPEWDGSQPLAGRTILVYAEQAFGDTIQFLRFVRPLAERGARVLLRLHPELHALAATFQPPPAAVLRPQDPLPEFDYHISIMSLPCRLGITLETLDAQPYLRSDAALRAQWEARLGPRTAPRLGLAWSGKPLPDPHRSVLLEPMLAALPEGFRLVSLQKEVLEHDRAALAASPRLLHVGDELRSFADTAALIACMDLVVSIDTGVAHLAGALGTPMRLLLPYVPGWPWMLEREDCPWYANAQLRRQDASRDWGPVLRRLRAELEAERDALAARNAAGATGPASA